MKKTILRIFVPLLCALMLLTSCSKAPVLKYEDGVYKLNGVTYIPASTCYEATSILEEKVVARIENKQMDDLLFYAIDGVEPSKMISSADYELFYAEGVTLPELWEMSPVKVHICQTASITYSLATVDGSKDIAGLIDAYQNGAAFPASEIDATLQKEKYDLKFESTLYPGFYYCLTYWQFEEDVVVYQVVENVNDFENIYPGVEVTTEDYHYTENGEEKVEHYAVYHFGTGILYNRSTGKCYAVGDTVAKYLENAAD